MKIQKKLLWVLLAVICAAFLLYVLMTKGAGDHTPPELTVPETPLLTSVYADESELMNGVTAIDAEDGDVTDLVIVESISDVHDGGQAVITYAAFDYSGNVAKDQRPLEYTDYSGPHFTLSEPLIFREGTRLDVFAPVGASDSMDGSLNERIKGTLVSGQSAVDRAGLYEVEFRVTNSLGDTAHLRVPVEVVSSGSTQRRLALSSYLVYLERGSSFDPEDYLIRGWDYLEDVESDVNTAVPGTYSVTYTDQNGDPYGKTRLIVVVEE